MNKRIIIIFLLLLSLSYMPYSASSQPFENTVVVHAPAVAMENGVYVGVISEMEVSTSPGDGSIFVETWPLSEIDVQASARIAVAVASELTGKDVNLLNYYYSIKSNAPVIGGPSAGAILTVATVSSINGWDVDPKVMMTGMINPDGTIGPVGGIYEKAEAASNFGIERFLVPEGQAVVQHEDEEIDLRIYAPEMWGMEVIEVFGIEDAIFEFTGYEFEYNEYSGNIEIDTSFCKSFVDEELTCTEQMGHEASALLFDSNIDSDVSEGLNEYLISANKRLQDAKDSIEQEQYYTALSFLFQARISFTYVMYSLEYLESDTREETLSTLLENVQKYLDEVSGEVKDMAGEIHGFSMLEAFSAAQERSFESQKYLDEARKQIVWNNPGNATYNTAFAYERARTAKFWLNMAETFYEGDLIGIEQLRTDAETIINDANLTLIYASQLNSSSSWLSGAQELLERSQHEYANGDYAAALFNAIESKTRSSVAIQLFSCGEDCIGSSMERARESAAVAIERQKSYGITPVLSIAYFEFASTFEEVEGYDQAIVYYKYSEGIANAFKYLMAGLAKDQHTFIYVGEDKGALYWPIAGYVLIGIIFGFAISMLVTRNLEKHKIYKEN